MDSRGKLRACVCALFPVIFILSSTSTSAAIKPNVIYGDDNRTDISGVTDSAVREAARSVAAMVTNSAVKITKDRARLVGRTLGQEFNLCSGEPFASQPTPAMCTGFLVGPDLLVTAGHCAKSSLDCGANKWVFDFTDLSLLAEGGAEVPATSVYGCKKIVDQAYGSGDLDYAVIQLDRPVTDRAPLRLRTSGSIALRDPVMVMGHPSGLPLKVAGGANVRDTSSAIYFSANLDTYGGNSGSPVFNQITGEIEGILVRGENDYVDDYKKGCSISNHCSNSGCRGEDVTRITQVPILNGGTPTPPKR